MSLKEELGKIEQEEEESTEEEERLREIEESIYGLYRRIAVIVEYIDKETRKEEQEIKTIRAKALKLRSLALDLKIKSITKILKEQENEKEGTTSEYVKGYEDGVKALSEKIEADKGEELKEDETGKKIGFGLGKKIGDV